MGQQIIEDLNGVESVTEMTGAAGGFGLGVITSPIMIIFCVILMAYAVIKVFFSNLKRGGILLQNLYTSPKDAGAWDRPAWVCRTCKKIVMEYW